MQSRHHLRLAGLGPVVDYVQAHPLVTADTFLARVISPMERTFGITLLGRGTVGALAQPLRTNGNGTNGGVVGQ